MGQIVILSNFPGFSGWRGDFVFSKGKLDSILQDSVDGPRTEEREREREYMCMRDAGSGQI